MTGDAIPPAGVGRGRILLLGAIAALGSLATQLLVPALPVLATDLGIGVSSAQLVIGVFLIGIGGGQLVFGTLADRVDRRTLLVAGLLLYAAGSVAAALSQGLELLLAGRLVQAIGASAGLVTARVLLNSMVPPERAVAAQAGLMAVVLVSPALAPVIGGLLTELVGWRAIMGGLCGAGLASAGIVFLAIPRVPDGPAKEPRTGLARSYVRLLRNRRFVAATAAMGFASATLYLFLGAAPFFLEARHGLSPRETGWCLLLVACASIAGTRLVGRMTGRFDPLVTGTAMGLCAAVLLAVASFADPATLPVAPLVLVLGPLALLGFTAGLIGPAAITHIMASEPGIEGTATSLAGALQMTTSALFAWSLGHFAAQSAQNLGLAMIPLTAIATLAAIVLKRRNPG